TKGYICGVMFVWIAGISVGGLTLLSVYNIMDLVHFAVVVSFITAASLITIGLSYLAIRTRLNCRVPAIDAAPQCAGPESKTRQDSIYCDSCVSCLFSSKYCWLFNSLSVFRVC
ncbi:hypothetical protein ACROYT_G024663, partial [Oculina patagonica]